MEKNDQTKDAGTTRSRVFATIGAVLTILLIVLIILSFTSSKGHDTVTLTYAEVNPLDGTIAGEMAKAFKEKAEELSGGTIVIDIQANGVLGSEEQLLDNMLGGGNLTDITRISALELTKYGCGKASLLAVPYTFVNEDHFWNFADSEVADELLMEPHEIGLPLRGLAFGEEGFRNFFFREPVDGLEDLKGRKIRVSSDSIMTGMVSDIGGSATVVSFSELYSSLSTGVVDGAEQPTANYLSNAFQEVAPYLILDGHTLGTMEIIISDHSWEQLDEQQKAWLEEAADYASSVCREKVNEIETEAFNTLRDKGCTIVAVDDKKPWVDACQNTISKFSGDQAELYQRIVDMQ